MKALLLVMAAVLAAGLLCVAGCGGDDGVSPPPAPTVPEIPQPAFYGDPDVPTRSEELVVATCRPSEFWPIVEAARFPDPGYGLEPDTLYSLVLSGANANTAGIRRYPLIHDDAVVTAPSISIQVAHDGGYPVVPLRGYPVDDWPTLQDVRYCVRLADVEYYAGGIEISVERSVTTGMSETTAESFSKTLGIEASVSGSWFVDFSVTVSTEFQWTESSETTYGAATTETTSFTIGHEADKNVGYAVWTLVEEFRFVDDAGEPFTDWAYAFAPDSIASATHRTPTTVPVSTYFDQ